MPKPGRQFEEAVHEFCKELDPNASVRFDHRVPDRDTGQLRQVDVWVEANLFGHYPVAMLVSCKDHRRPLGVGDVETLMGEMKSTGASIGVLYSSAGFTETAVAKARANRVSCCRLFQDAPPERPSELWLEAFVAFPWFAVLLDPADRNGPPEALWRDLPVLLLEGLGKAKYTRAIAESCLGMVTRQSGVGGPESETQSGHQKIVRFPECEASPAFRLHIALTWDWFRGGLNAFRLRGSHNALDGSFKGKTTVGPVPMAATPPSPEWERCAPPDADTGRIRVVITAFAGPTPEIVAQAMGPTSIFRGGPWRFGTPDIRSLGAMIDQQLGLSVHFGS